MLVTTFSARIIARVTFAALIVSSCGDVSQSSNLTVRDSAGIRIVEVADPRPTSDSRSLPHVLTAALDLSIGVVDGDEAYTFGRVTDVAATPDGRIVVIDAQQLRIRVYSPDGRALAQMGGRGGGPAEFMAMGELWLRHDTISVHDSRNRKVATFTAAGQFLDTRPVGTGARAVTGGQYKPLGRDGYVVTRVVGCSMPRRPDHVDNQWVAYVTDREGGILDTLDTRTVSQSLPVYGTSFCTVVGVPFGRTIHLVRSPDDRWAMGDGGTYEIRLFRIRYPAERDLSRVAGDGNRDDAGLAHDVMFLRRVYEPRPLTDAERERYRETTVERIRDGEMRSATERALADLHFPATWPAYSALRFDDVGRLWVLRAAPRLPGEEPASINVWDVYDSGGALLHEVRLPREIGLRSIRNDFIYGTFTDDLGVYYVRRWRLVPATPASNSAN